jgi:hypothetical protein
MLFTLDPKQGDYFGLILVGAAKTDNIIIHTLQEMKQPQKQLSVSVLQSDNMWIHCKVADKAVAGSVVTNRISLGVNCPSAIRYFRAIKVTFTEDQLQPIDICGLSIDNLAV